MVRMLNLAVPNVSIVVLDSDLLFLRPGDDEAYHHVFAVSPLPLMPGNLDWTQRGEVDCRQKPPRHLFSSSGAESVYLSTLYLAQDKDGEHGKSKDDLAACAFDYSSPS